MIPHGATEGSWGPDNTAKLQEESTAAVQCGSLRGSYSPTMMGLLLQYLPLRGAIARSQVSQALAPGGSWENPQHATQI